MHTSALADGAHGTLIRAGAAVNAGIADDILRIALADRAHGALIRASAAGDASVTDHIHVK